MKRHGKVATSSELAEKVSKLSYRELSKVLNYFAQHSNKQIFKPNPNAGVPNIPTYVNSALEKFKNYLLQNNRPDEILSLFPERALPPSAAPGVDDFLFRHTIVSIINIILFDLKASIDNFDEFLDNVTFGDLADYLQKKLDFIKSTNFSKTLTKLLDIVWENSEWVVFSPAKKLNIPDTELVYTAYRFLPWTKEQDLHTIEIKSGKQVTHVKTLQYDEFESFDKFIETLNNEEKRNRTLETIVEHWVRYLKFVPDFIQSFHQVIDVEYMPIILSPIVKNFQSANPDIFYVDSNGWYIHGLGDMSFVKKISAATTSNPKHVMKMYDIAGSDKRTIGLVKASEPTSLASQTFSHFINRLQREKLEFKGSVKVHVSAFYGLARYIQNINLYRNKLYWDGDYISFLVDSYTGNISFGSHFYIMVFVEDTQTGTFFKFITEIGSPYQVRLYEPNTDTTITKPPFSSATLGPHNYLTFVSGNNKLTFDVKVEGTGL